MSAAGKYRAIAVDTFEERKRHRVMIEEALRRIDVTPAFRRELEAEFKYALRKERLAAHDIEEAEAKDEEEGKEGEGSSSGGNSGGGTGGGGGGADIAHDTQSDDSGAEREGELSDSEAVGLLFFLAEIDIGVTRLADPDVSSAPVAAETLLFNREEGVARIHEPFVGAPEAQPDNRSAFLPLLEQHAVSIGARALHVHVHTEVVALFQKQYGFKPQGKLAMRNGTPLQRMSKNLPRPALPQNDIS